jgi:hypothetical protein
MYTLLGVMMRLSLWRAAQTQCQRVLMMTKGYRIRIIGDRASDIHRTRNMAEELCFEFIRRGYGTTSNPDTMSTEFQLTIEAKRYLGEAAKLIRRVLKKHYMENDVEIEKL